jgi:hypothetical protein
MDQNGIDFDGDNALRTLQQRFGERTSARANLDQ